MGTLTGKYSRRSLRLAPMPMAQGGEGAIYATDQSRYVAKIYHKPTHLHYKKLMVMVRRPPDLNRNGHVSLAWPVDILLDHRGHFTGYLMLRVRGGLCLHSLCVPKSRKKMAPGFDMRYLHTTALNYALCVSRIHDSGYVIGDIKTENALVNSKAQVTLVDCDSFQVPLTEQNLILPCPVGSEGFVPPELIDVRDFSKTARLEVHDLFGLAVIVFYLLFGCHPFKGKWSGNSEPAAVNESVKNGWWMFGDGSLIQTSEFTPPFMAIHPNIQNLFQRCFSRGHNSPKLRPTAKDWIEGLRVGLDDLVSCVHNPIHLHSKASGFCWLCEVDGKRQSIARSGKPTQDRSVWEIFKDFMNQKVETI